MRIVLDGMGSDHYPGPEVTAAVAAARQFGVEVLLVGREDLLEPALEALSPGQSPVRIIHAPEALEMGDKPAASARGKGMNSMAVGMDLVKSGEADAFVTAGSTGGAMASALFRLGRLRGVKRPALAAAIPVRNGVAVVLDIGANTECKPEYLVQFAVMGSVYAEKVTGVRSPRVGLLSNGEEAGKGNDLVKETYPLLQASKLNFIGNVEGKELFGGAADVVVTDGFTGNVLLKSSEAVAKLLTELIRDEIKASPVTALGGLLARPAFAKVRKVLDPAEHGAATLLGVNGLVFIGHGRSDAKALTSAVRVARQAVESGLMERLRAEIGGRLAETEASPQAEAVEGSV